MITLTDTAEQVTQASQAVLLPSLADWAMDLNKLDTHLVPSILSRIESCLDVSIFWTSCYQLYIFV